MKQILSQQEIQRNQRLKELWKERQSKPVQEKTNEMPLKLSIKQMDEVKALMKEQGLSREEAVKCVLYVNNYMTTKNIQ